MTAEKLLHNINREFYNYINLFAFNRLRFSLCRYFNDYMIYKNLLLNFNNSVATITLNRPEVRNALNSAFVEELYSVFDELNHDANVRCIVITGSGKTFCAGADLNWLGEINEYTYSQNYDESKRLIELLYLIHNHSKPVIAKVNGSAVGGGVGLMLVSDIIISDEDAIFGLSEVSIGIVPAAIIPFMLDRIGETKAREYLITGERINAQTAKEIGLINYTYNRDKIHVETERIINLILNNGPSAVKTVKEMINVLKYASESQTIDYIAEIIAKLRMGTEGQEGIKSFLEKRAPNWRT